MNGHDANLVTAGSRDTAHKYFCDCLKTDESRSRPTFCVQSGFASGSVHARLQVSVYSGYDLCHHLMSQTNRPTDRQTVFV